MQTHMHESIQAIDVRGRHLPPIARRVSAFLDRMREGPRLRRDYLALKAMDDYHLRDIGLTRADITATYIRRRRALMRMF